MHAHPRFGVVVAFAASLAFAIVALLVPGTMFWARVAPERYLVGATAFFGPVTDDDDGGHFLHDDVIAWRRLARARDSAAFERLARRASAAGRLYGLAGLRLLAPAEATKHRETSTVATP